MKLYHHSFSSNARKAVMTAKLLGSPVELVTVDLAAGAQRAPDHLALNPNAKVPVLVDGDFVLWESCAIMTYLAEKSGESALYPRELRARTDVHRWMFWSAHHFTPAVTGLNYENILKKLFGRGEPDPAFVGKYEQDLRALCGVLESHLASRSFLSGNALTLADVAVACPLMTTVPARLPVESFKNLQSWFGRVRDLDAWRQTEPPR